jgi:BirA family biotin operon repressor/biotin-[acetyl-CoA-carboxylase] ligase
VTGWPAGIDRLTLEETGSTMDEARARAAAGAPGPLWIMARRQTGGRGRRGSAWTAPEGNLNATLLIRPEMAARDAARLSFAAALAVADLLAALAPGARVETKWPNDVLLEGGKASGILLESEGRAGRLDWVSVGIGVNLVAAPQAEPGAAAPPTALARHIADPPAPEAALERLAVAFADWLARYRAEGFEPLRAAWLARAARLGETVEARLPSRTLRGVFADLDADGALVLDTPSGARRIAAAEVFFP